MGHKHRLVRCGDGGAATSQISYTAPKGGVLALSRELNVLFARQGVRVNACAPAP